MTEKTDRAGGDELVFLRPDWPAPPSVGAAVSLRSGGVSARPYASLNLGDHVGDASGAVAENRRRLCTALGLPREPLWLRQVHGTRVVSLPPGGGGVGERGRHPESAPSAPSFLPQGERGVGSHQIEADACWTTEPGTVCAILTADCLPVLFCDDAGRHVAAAHAGWRGLAAGVLERTVQVLPVAPQKLMAWLGPAIGPQRFEVGPEVREAFTGADAAASTCFTALGGGKHLADLYELARRRLQQAGIQGIFGGGHCTRSEAASFFSHRRDGRCGRMASLIWLQA